MAATPAKPTRAAYSDMRAAEPLRFPQGTGVPQLYSVNHSDAMKLPQFRCTDTSDCTEASHVHFVYAFGLLAPALIISWPSSKSVDYSESSGDRLVRSGILVCEASC